jgi:type III secretion protein N (ATPase)
MTNSVPPIPSFSVPPDNWLEALVTTSPVVMYGRVANALGTLITVVGTDAAIGELCELRVRAGHSVLAEVVGFKEGACILMPYGTLDGLSSSTQAISLRRTFQTPAGPGVLGRVLDGFGQPIDGKGPLEDVHNVPVSAQPPDPMSRKPIDSIFETGVRALDAFITVGHGQRLGIFAPAGGGKSTLMGMLAKYGNCDVNVLALIGERGREVSEFIEHSLGPEGMRRSVVVVATSDKSAAERIKAAQVAAAIAETYRAQGKKVLFMMDSTTRFARALREVGLASGEPPTRRGFPPSVFAILPQLLERAGNDSKGSMTAFYTVLVDGVDDDDPIAEEVRSILDGHIVLSRALGQKGHYPAIDVLASVSRVMTLISTRAHQDAAKKVRSLMAKYKDVELLLQLGEYKAGADPVGDEAVAKNTAIQNFLQQRADEFSSFEQTNEQLKRLSS